MIKRMRRASPPKFNVEFAYEGGMKLRWAIQLLLGESSFKRSAYRRNI
jgi:hypothetical protein